MMRKLIAVFLLSVYSVAAIELSAPEIGFDSEKYDFGKVKKGTVVTHTFIVMNNGDQPLIISKVVPSCGCTVASFTKEPIKPGGRGEITVKFNSKGRPIGQNLKTFSVFSNAKNAPHTIYIKGDLTK